MSNRLARTSEIVWMAAAISLAVCDGSGTARASEPSSGSAAMTSGIKAKLVAMEEEAQGLSANGKWAESEAIYRQMIGDVMSLAPPNPLVLLSLKMKLAEAVWNQGRNAEGQEFAKRAITDAQAASVDEESLALAKIALGYSYVSNIRLKEMEAVGAELMSHLPRGGKRQAIIEAQAAVMQSSALHAQYEFSESNRILLNTISNLRKIDSKSAVLGLALCLYTLGDFYTTQDKLTEANSSLREALNLARGLKNADKLGISIAASFVQNLANLGMLDEALTLGLRAEEEFNQKSVSGKSDTANLSVAVSRIWLVKKQYEKAENAAKRVIETLPPQEADQYQRVVLKDAHNILVEIYEVQNRWREAENEAMQVKVLSEQISPGDNVTSLTAEVTRGYSIAMSGRVVEGEKIIINARKREMAILSPSDNAVLIANLALAQTRFGYQKLADSLTPARDSLRVLREKVQIFDGTRGAGDSYSSNPSSLYGSELRQVYETFSEATWRASKVESKDFLSFGSSALVALQEASVGPTSQAIVQATLRAVASQRSNELGELVSERQVLASTYARNDSALAKLRFEKKLDRSRIASLEAEQARTLVRSGQIDQEIRKSFPDFAEFAQARQLDLKTVQALLAADEALLFVVPTHFGTHSIAVTRTTFGWHRSEMTAESVGEAVRRLLWDCGADVGVDAATAARWETEGGGGYSYDRKTAYSLYQQLVAPVATTLAGKRKLYVVATDSLSSLPFGILVTQPPQGRDGDPLALRSSAWLADAFAITAVPTIQTLQLLKNRATHAPGAEGKTPISFAGFGDPLLGKQGASRGSRMTLRRTLSAKVQSGSRDRPKLGGMSARLKTLAGLPGTATELEGMRQALGASSGSLRLGARNTETNVKDSDLSSVRVLAFATHGLMSGELFTGAEAGLVFTPPKKESVKDDGYLTASEIMGLRLNTDWVILSACNTAAGDGTAGATGLSGLARSFFFAGARNLLVSHWPVRDDVAEKITVEAIRQKREKPELSRSEALGLAMRKVRDDASSDSPNDTWAHPNAWAPFSLVGDGG